MKLPIKRILAKDEQKLHPVREEEQTSEPTQPDDIVLSDDLIASEDEEATPDASLSFDEPFQKERIGWHGQRAVIVVAAAILLIAGIVAAALLLPQSGGHPVISEVMSSNDNAYRHPAYGSVDWVELYNPTDRDIDLSGFGFTDEIKKQYKYIFPEGTVLKRGEYLVLYCTGGTAASDSDPFCTGFSLSQEGETLFLIGRAYVELDEVAVPYLETDTAYVRRPDGAFAVTRVVTPGAANSFSD